MHSSTTASSDDRALLRSPVPGLFSTPTAPLPFMSGVVVRSFVLQREQGNVVIYNSPGIDAAAREIRALGQPSHLLVNHWHEAMYPAPDLDVPVFVHRLDRAQTERSLPVAGVFDMRQMLGDDLEVIPTPGHTAGVTMFLWDNGEHRFLFTGDSIWLHGSRWEAVVLDESNRDDYLDSLTLIQDLDFDVLVPWGAQEGQPYVHVVDRRQAQEQLSAITTRIRAGGNR